MSVKSLKLKHRYRNSNPHMTLEEKQDFDSAYNCPRTNHLYKMPMGTTCREKRGDYMTVTTEKHPQNDLMKVFLNKRPSTPGSIVHSRVKDWTKGIVRPNIGKAEKVTFVKEIFLKEKREKSPAPNSYVHQHKEKKN